ncbi:hypothetical protein ACJ2A9_21925 [Anaerobacillus sp. MEB173]|uniref:hypothetical protein n=1 Tax=Anaerobacillus sp. MEB173 TaxID=3383345 RepID=UPI003F91C240
MNGHKELFKTEEALQSALALEDVPKLLETINQLRAIKNKGEKALILPSINKSSRS